MKNNTKLMGRIEWIIVIVLLVVCINNEYFKYGKFSPIKAHEASERTFHYGPSEIVETIDTDDIKIYLCRYKKWVSMSTITKDYLKWKIRGNAIKEIKADEKVSWSYSGSKIKGYGLLMRVFGYVSDEDISTITLEVEGATGNKVLEYELNENRMFIFYWNDEEEKYELEKLKGINDHGEIGYDKEFY